MNRLTTLTRTCAGALTEALIEFEGALVVVSHDRHLIRSTTDDLYLVHDGKVEPFEGSGRLSAVAERRPKAGESASGCRG